MRNSYILEISVETLDAALAAQRGGAHRIELCSSLAQKGLTPGTALMRTVREQVTLPIFAMIRPRGGDFVYSGAEFATIQRDIETAKQLGMDGVVLGILKEDSHVDIERTKQLVGLARPLPVTFHRAFDISADLRKSLEDVIQTGAARILTSGGASTAPEGLAALAKLVEIAIGRILIVPGSGINASNVLRVARHTGAREFHSGLSSAVSGARGSRNSFEAEVRKLSFLLIPGETKFKKTSETDSGPEHRRVRNRARSVSPPSLRILEPWRLSSHLPEGLAVFRASSERTHEN